LFMMYGNVYQVSDEKWLWNVKMHASTCTPLYHMFEYLWLVLDSQGVPGLGLT
jgi:hypothetical protein